ncbi:MAG: alpha/beta fold hydrolase [Alphaproteobacteria bacterium]|nr:alpha/beta fold hydrolase [Alphaproteobacteria bacterium]
MTMCINLPGIGGSGNTHWQSFWEAENESFQRFNPMSWDQPDLSDWVNALQDCVSGVKEAPVLVAHSLACLLVAHAAPKIARKVRGAFLVAVPDPDAPAFPKEAMTFREVPSIRLPFPSLILASDDDPFGTTDYARRRAGEWGAGLILVGALGHINGASGLGDWKTGRALLEGFCNGLE